MRAPLGARAFLGNPVDQGGGSGELDLGDGRGRARDYEKRIDPLAFADGRARGARRHPREVGGARWSPELPGYAETDETPCPDARGRFNHFEVIDLLDSSDRSERGPWRDPRSLGQHGLRTLRPALPVTDDGKMAGGRISHFDGGEIRWTPPVALKRCSASRSTTTRRGSGRPACERGPGAPRGAAGCRCRRSRVNDEVIRIADLLRRPCGRRPDTVALRLEGPECALVRNRSFASRSVALRSDLEDCGQPNVFRSSSVPLEWQATISRPARFQRSGVHSRGERR
jgi:hypothetical protein